MLRRLYNLLFPFVFLLLLPGYLRRLMRRAHYRHALGQRFGRYSNALRSRLSRGRPRPWIQAVSVGEMLVALKLVAALRVRCPDLPLVLSATTTTGFMLATARADPHVEVVYTPIDASGFVRRAFDVLRPSHIIIVDGGIWPNILWEAKKRALPVSLVNARLSPRSQRRWRRFAMITRPVMRLLDLVCVPGAEDVPRWQEVGVPAERIRPTGSIKFDEAAASIPVPHFPGSRLENVAGSTGALQRYLRQIGVPEGARILLAGSTHVGEERTVCEVYLRLRQSFPDLFLIVAPRHVERAAEIVAQFASFQLQTISRSQPAAESATLTSTTRGPDVLLLDTTGELREWYAVATVVFVGKSLSATGGQNPIEPIAAGKPVIFGPNMSNFAALVAQLLKVGGATQINDAAGLERACAHFLADPAAAERQLVAARSVLAEHAGAAARTADLLLRQGGFPACQPP